MSFSVTITKVCHWFRTIKGVYPKYTMFLVMSFSIYDRYWFHQFLNLSCIVLSTLVFNSERQQLLESLRLSCVKSFKYLFVNLYIAWSFLFIFFYCYLLVLPRIWSLLILSNHYQIDRILFFFLVLFWGSKYSLFL